MWCVFSTLFMTVSVSTWRYKSNAMHDTTQSFCVLFYKSTHTEREREYDTWYSNGIIVSTHSNATHFFITQILRSCNHCCNFGFATNVCLCVSLVFACMIYCKHMSNIHLKYTYRNIAANVWVWAWTVQCVRVCVCVILFFR